MEGHHWWEPCIERLTTKIVVLMGKNLVYIATSLDGYIADKNGGLEWLDKIPVDKGVDMGYHAFMERVDALVMGRNTFETVLSFDVEWPYQKPVLVVSGSMDRIPESHTQHAQLVSGSPQEIRDLASEKGYQNLYIDGGQTVQRFLRAGLIDEMIITTIPVILGGGASLFGDLDQPQWYSLTKTEVFSKEYLQRTYIKTR